MRQLLITVVSSVILAAPVMAQVDPKIHKLCIEAKDYKGCVKLHNQIDDPQAIKSDDKEKLVQIYAKLLCEDGNGFGEWNQEKRSSVAALHTGLKYDLVLSESDFSKPQNDVRDKMQTISSAKCPDQQEAYIRKKAEIGNLAWSAIKDQQPSIYAPAGRPADGASVATWQDYCNSLGKTYYERTSGLSWFGIKLSSKKEWQGCLTDAEAAQSGAGVTTYKPVNPRPPVNCYGSGYVTGGKSFSTTTTCY